MINFLFVGAALLILSSCGLAVAYRSWLRPAVAQHFGEEYPSLRDREATCRRRSFERSCGLALTWIYFFSIAGVVRGLVNELIPQIETELLIGQITFLPFVGLFIWAAAARWNEPFEN